MDEEGRRAPWPQIDSYQEKGITVKVMKSAWLEGAEQDHVVKPRRKKR